MRGDLFEKMLALLPDGYKFKRSERDEFWRNFYFYKGRKGLMLSLPLTD